MASGDHAAAFARYEQRLRGYIAGGQKQAAGSQASSHRPDQLPTTCPEVRITYQ